MDSGQTEAGSLYSKKREQKVREVQPSINMNSDLEEKKKQEKKKKKSIYTFTADITCSVEVPEMAEQLQHRREFCSHRCNCVCLQTQNLQPHGLDTPLSRSPIFCLRQCRVLDQLSELTRPASVHLII